jgi:tetratricopeptide (TPR) repeat protein
MFIQATSNIETKISRSGIMRRLWAAASPIATIFAMSIIFVPKPSMAQNFPTPGIECVESAYGCPGGGGGAVAGNDPGEGVTVPDPSSNRLQRAKALNDEGIAASNRGDLTTAISKYRQALALLPNSRVIRSNLVWAEAAVLTMQHDYARAAAKFEEAVVLNPSRAEKIRGEMARAATRANNEGVDLFEKGNLQAAITTLKQALALNPKDNVIHGNLSLAQGFSSVKRGDDDTAVAHYCNAFAMNPKKTTDYLINTMKAWVAKIGHKFEVRCPAVAVAVRG